MSPVVKERNHCSSPITNCLQTNIEIKEVRTKGQQFYCHGMARLRSYYIT